MENSGLKEYLNEEKDLSSMSAEEIYNAGRFRKNFDYKKGLDLLIKKNNNYYIFVAGIFWPRFNYKKGLEALKKTKYYNEALKQWPKGAKETEKIMKQLEQRSKKFPGKKLRLKEYLNEEKDLSSMSAEEIYNAGIETKTRKNFDYEKGFNELAKKDKSGYWFILAGQNWPKFDYKKGFDILIKKDKEGDLIVNAGIEWPKFDYKKGLDELIKRNYDGEYIFLAGSDWPEFDYERAEKILRNTKYHDKIFKNWPKGSWLTKKIISKLEKEAQKMPTKKLKLKEWLNEEDLSSMSAKEIYYAGKDWKQFNYEKGLDALIQKDKTGRWIFYAGKDWKQFNYKKGLDALIQKDKTGEEIYYAGINWKQFNYEKGLDALKRTKYYDNAIKDWPKDAKETKKMIDQLKQRSKKMPTKKLKLKEWLNEGMHDRGIFKAIFLVGGPGSGKSTISKKLLSGTAGWKVINPDILYEYLMKKENIPLDYKKRTKEQEKKHKDFELVSRDKLMSQEEQYLRGRLPILIDRTGYHYEAVMRHKKALEDLGYEVGMIFVDVPQKEAFKRNLTRERKLDIEFIKKYDPKIRQIIPLYKQHFGNRFWRIDNSKELTREKIQTEIQKIREKIFKWINTPTKNEKVSQWLKNQREQKIKS